MRDGLVCPVEAGFISYRCFGDPKIPKPKPLAGLKPVAKFPIFGKSASLFLPEDGFAVVHFAEMFCRYVEVPEPGDMFLPTSALQRKYPWYSRKKARNGFIYADGWCKAFKRNEGYVRFTGLREQFDRRMLARPFIPAVSEAAYGCLERLSASDPRLYRLNGTCEQSVAYRRVANDIVVWLAKAARAGETARTAHLTANAAP